MEAQEGVSQSNQIRVLEKRIEELEGEVEQKDKQLQVLVTQYEREFEELRAELDEGGSSSASSVTRSHNNRCRAWILQSLDSGRQWFWHRIEAIHTRL